MNSHIQLIEREPRTDERAIIVWTDKRLDKEEIEALAHWLESEGYVDDECTHVKICQRLVRPRVHISMTLASIVMFLFLMSMAIYCYFS